MITITRVFKKYYAFNHAFIQRSYNSWINARNLIDSLEKHKNNIITIGITNELTDDFKKFKITKDVTFSFVDSENEIIISLIVDDEFADSEIQLSLKGWEIKTLTSPYFNGDSHIYIADEVGFALLMKSETKYNETYKFSIKKEYKVITYNDYNFVLFEKSKTAISLDVFISQLNKEYKKIYFIEDRIDDYYFNKQDYSKVKYQKCQTSYKILSDKDDKTIEVTLHTNIEKTSECEFMIVANGIIMNTIHEPLQGYHVVGVSNYCNLYMILRNKTPLIKTKIISAFPSMGKSYFTKNNNSLTSIDSDSSKFSWISEGVRHPNFPSNYIKHIKENIGKVDLIFVSSHKQVRDAMSESGIDFMVVYPNRDKKDEICKRIQQRDGNNKLSSFIESNWENFFDEIEKSDNLVQYINGYICDDIF